MTALLIAIIRVYQLAISPLLGQNCRFAPTCSAYTIEALRTHGLRKGLWLSIKRLVKCHPWHPGGHDPVSTCGKPHTDVLNIHTTTDSKSTESTNN